MNGDIVELPDGVHLANGSEVEIHTLDESVPDEQQVLAEQRFRQWLLESGLVTQLPPEDCSDDLSDFEPIEVEGELLSNQIIRERR